MAVRSATINVMVKAAQKAARGLVRDFGEALIATGTPNLGRTDHAAYLAMFGAVAAQTAGIRRFGAAALDLAYVAAGRYDGYFEVGLSPWDVAAGIILVREAGGYVSEI